MNLKELEKTINSIAGQDNGISGIYIIDGKSGDEVAKSGAEAGADGGIDWSKFEVIMASLINIRDTLSESKDSGLGESRNMSIYFKKGGLIISDTGGDNPVMIVFVNLNPKKMGPATRTANIETQNIAELL